MKDRKTKEKKHESTIGKIIYGFLLFLPLFAIGVTCGYVMFNKNAYQSYNMSTETSNLNLNGSYTSHDNEKIYIYAPSILYNQFDSNTKIFSVSGEYIKQISDNFYSSTNTPLDVTITNIQIGMGTNGQQINVLYNGAWHNTQNIWGNTINEIIFTLNSGFTYNYYNTQANYEAVIYLLNDVTLQDTFYYSIDKVQESPLFNWAENSIIYTGMNSFTTSLSITTPFIPLLLTYWLIISVVYFLYDIVLIILVVLHRKIHYLEESI